MKKEIKYDIKEKGCWECTSHKTNEYGYPLITLKGKSKLLRRYMYEQKYNITLDIKEKLYSTCNNKLCINPNHYYIVKERKEIKYIEVQNYRNNGDEIKGKCWECTSHSIGNHGYIQYIDPDTKKITLLHRYILEKKLGRKLKENMCACHVCDNKLCINPEHLEEHTRDWNNKDKMLKGRTSPNVGRPSTIPKITKTVLKTILVIIDKEEIIYNFKIDISNEHNIPLKIIDKLLENRLEEYNGIKIRWINRKSYKRQIDNPIYKKK